MFDSQKHEEPECLASEKTNINTSNKAMNEEDQKHCESTLKKKLELTTGAKGT